MAHNWLVHLWLLNCSVSMLSKINSTLLNVYKYFLDWNDSWKSVISTKVLWWTKRRRGVLNSAEDYAHLRSREYNLTQRLSPLSFCPPRVLGRYKTWNFYSRFAPDRNRLVEIFFSKSRPNRQWKVAEVDNGILRTVCFPLLFFPKTQNVTRPTQK